jgi:hypothetical protein
MKGDENDDSRWGAETNSEFEKLGTQGLRAVSPSAWNAKERQPVGGEELVDEIVTLYAVRAVVRTVVELNGAQDAASAWIGQDEVDVLPRYLVECGLLAAPLPHFEKIGETHLG